MKYFLLRKKNKHSSTRQHHNSSIHQDMKILITGGTGLVGMHLSRMLRDSGHEVSHLSRKANSQAEFPAYHWNIDEGFVDAEALAQADHIVHLAGASIVGKRWTAQRKQHIIDSRVKSIELLARKIKAADLSPKSFISASAVGYYGNTGDQIITEQSPAGDSGFLVKSCKLWEQATEKVEVLGIRTVRIRLGIVLSVLDGALPKILLSFKVNTGTWFGDGSQYYPWVHIDDVARMFAKAIEDNTMKGVYNATAPNPVTNKSFIKILAKALDKKALLVPTPAFVMRLAMGEMADTVLHGSRVIPERISATDFEFKFEDLEAAFRDVVRREV